MIERWLIAGIALCGACKGGHHERTPAESDPRDSGTTVEPVFSQGERVSRDGIPALAFAIDHVHEQQQPTDAPPYHAGGGTWTYFDAHVAGDPAATFTVGAPRLGGGEHRSFFKMLLVPTTAAAGSRVVQAFAKAFAVPVPPPTPGQRSLAPTSVGMAVPGHRISNQGDGSAGTGDWHATSWVLTLDEGDVEILCDFSFAEKRGELSEKARASDAGVARALAIALRDGQPAPRTPATDPTLAANAAELVLGARLPGKRVAVIASSAERAIVAIEYDDRAALAAIELSSGTVTEIYTTVNELAIGDCDHDVQRCVFREDPRESRTVPSGKDPTHLFELDGMKVTPLAIPLRPYDPVRISPDARFLLIGSYVGWDLARKRKLATFADDHGERDFLGWRGDAIVLAHHETIESENIDRYELWNVETGKLETISHPTESLDGSVSPDGKRRVDADGGKAIVTPQPHGESRSLVLYPKDYNALEAAGCKWLDSRYVVVPGKRYGFLDTDAMKVSLVSDPPGGDVRMIRVLPGSGHVLVTTSAGTVLATVKP